MKNLAEAHNLLSGEVPTGDYVTMSSHIRENVIKLRNGEYIATWKLEGIPFETIEFVDLNQRKEALNNFLKTIGGGQFALWSHKLRRKVYDRLDGQYQNNFCRQMNERYMGTFDTYKMMATELYITIVFRPTTSKMGGLFNKSRLSAAEIKARQQVHIDALDDAAKQAEASLSKYQPERLGTYKIKNVIYSEMARFYGFLLNGVWEDVPLRRTALYDYLPSSRLFFGDKNGMLQIKHHKENKFAGFLDFQEYPKFSETGMNNAILYGKYEYIETQSFSMLNKRDALDALERQKGQLISGEDASESEISEMTLAEDQLRNGSIEMGEYHYSLAVFGSSVNDVANNLASARTAFDEPGFKMATIDLVPEAAWFSQLPGNWAWRPRAASITSYNFACLSPFHNFSSGKRNGNPWGEALALLKTPSGQPYYLNFHSSPEDKDNTDDKLPGNTSVIGTTGVGKTTSVNFLLALAQKYKGLRCVFFDKDRGAEIFIRASRGKYRAFKRGEPTGINPFQWPDTPSNRDLCESVVAQCVREKGKELTARDRQYISDAVKTVFSLPFQLRRLGAVDQVLPNTGENSLRLRLKRWIGNNPNGWVVDNPQDTLDLESSNFFGFDYTEFLDDDEVRPVVMLMLMHAVQGLINGQPFIYAMDEFWKPLMDEIFTDFAKNKQKTIRKENGLGIFITQSPSDVLLHAIGKTMVEQSVTKIFLPNPSADYNDYVNGFKLTPQEFAILQSLAEDSRMMLVKQNLRSAVVKLDLTGMHDEIVVLSGSIDNVELLDEIRDEVGDDPDIWLPILLQRVEDRRKASKLKSAA